MRSYNRGTTIHGVKYLRVERNCYWDVMGHAIFTQDGVETKNYIAYNVVAGTKPSFSLLNTDTTPGNFWISHPDNFVIGNRAAGSTAHGFFYKLAGQAAGMKLGKFSNNVAHSIDGGGVYIWRYEPREH